MTDKAINPLRRRMIEDMTIRKLAPKTQASYMRAVRDFTVLLGRSPQIFRARLGGSSGNLVPARTLP
jgi:integrase/recombinase XerD